MKTLVVDDVKVNCRVLQGLLSGYGECDIANDGASAVRLFNQALTGDAPYDLVCLDIMMPDYDGRQVLQALRRLEEQNDVGEDRQCRIFMVSSRDEDQIKIECDKLGCDAYLEKPIKVAELRAKLLATGLILVDRAI